jgi:hypothetical protein
MGDDHRGHVNLEENDDVRRHIQRDGPFRFHSLHTNQRLVDLLLVADFSTDRRKRR